MTYTRQELRLYAIGTGLAISECKACGQPTFWVQSARQPNAPRTCGRVACGQKMSEPWATKEWSVGDA